MKLFDIVKRAFAGEAATFAAPERRIETKYSRFNRHPANAHLPLAPGDRVLPNGQVVAKDSPRPIGELLLASDDDWRP